MAITGIVFRQSDPSFEIVTEYYGAAKREPTKRTEVLVDRTDVFTNTFKSLAEKILASKRSQIVVVAHGNARYGLIMPISPESNVSAGYCMPKLVQLVDRLDAGGGAMRSGDLPFLQATASDFRLSADTTLNIALTCQKIRRADAIASAVHVRGCDIGADKAHLAAIRSLFRSAVVSAPICPMFYVPVRPNTISAAAYARKHPVPQGRRALFEKPGLSPLLLDIQYLGARAGSHAALEKQSDLRGWGNVLHRTTLSAVSHSVPVAGLWPAGSNEYVLAHQSAPYAALLAAVRGS